MWVTLVFFGLVPGQDMFKYLMVWFLYKRCIATGVVVIGYFLWKEMYERVLVWKILAILLPQRCKKQFGCKSGVSKISTKLADSDLFGILREAHSKITRKYLGISK